MAAATGGLTMAAAIIAVVETGGRIPAAATMAGIGATVVGTAPGTATAGMVPHGRTMAADSTAANTIPAGIHADTDRRGAAMNRCRARRFRRPA